MLGTKINVFDTSVVKIDQKKYIYLLGTLDRPNSNFDKRGLENLIDDWTTAKGSSKKTISEYENTYSEMQILSGDSEVPFNDPREYFDRYVKSNPTIPNYQRYKDAIDFHDLSRNMELREGFELLGIPNTLEGRKLLENIFIQQVKIETPIKKPVNIGGVIYETRNYKSTIIGPNGRKMNLETRWTLIEGKPQFGTAIINRPPTLNRMSKNTLERVNGDWIDRLSIFRIIILTSKNS